MELRDRLEQMLHDLTSIRNASAEAARTVELDQSRVGRLSRMDALQQQAIAVEADRRRATEIRRVTAALKRIDNGEYGICLDCGEEIARKRLEVDPATARCVGCAGRAERRR